MPELKLIEAVKNDDLNSVETLLTHGEDSEKADAYGWTALNWAAGFGHTPIIQKLLEAGANVAHAGRDQRTAYQIALAAAHVESASALQQAAQKTSGSSCPATQPYCKAYLVTDLKQFPGWPKKLTDIADDTVVFLHEDLRVTRSLLQDEAVIFECASPVWEQFCRNQLGFAAPSEIDLAMMFVANRTNAASLKPL